MIWAIRHGAIDARARCIGWTDLPLTSPEATRDALRLVTARVPAPDRIHCSDLRRARHTAALLSELWGGLPVAPDARLRELYFGRWEALTWPEIERLDERAYWAFMDSWRTTRAPRGESYEDVVARVTAWREACGEARVVVAHHSSLRALAECLGCRDGFSLQWGYAQTRQLPPTPEAL